MIAMQCAVKKTTKYYEIALQKNNTPLECLRGHSLSVHVYVY